MILRVAVFAPVAGTFDYLPARDPKAPIPVPGMRVLVPFGRGRRVGVVVEHRTASALQAHRLRCVSAVLDEVPVFTADLLLLVTWATTYYHYPIGEVMGAALPTRLRLPRPAPLGPAHTWCLTPAGEEALDTAMAERAPRQQALLRLIHERRFDEATHLPLPFAWRRPLREIERKGWVMKQAAAPVASTSSPATEATQIVLNADQRHAVAEIVASRNEFRVLLLHGVTGSGKTEVYLSAAAAILASGRQVLILVPEIALTEQFISRIRQRFRCASVVLHSGCTEAERLRGWRAAASGEARLLLGTRSAIWTRCADLGLVVVDEEHDASYKQGEGFRYSARDTAVMRARQAGIPIVLGSATPSLESCANESRGRYQRLQLRDRAASAQPPSIRLLDMRRQEITAGLSRTLLDAIAVRRARGEQSLLFINRRGYAPILLCHNCGWAAQCTRCTTRLVYHKHAGMLLCHHCGSRQAWSGVHACCASPQPVALGLGTERVEETLRRLWPSARIARIDRDALRRRERWPELLTAIQEGQFDILVGTQMIAKGHHFPNVTLVGIVDVDGALYSLDFRATERLAQLITQVSGRAGRADKPGEVLLQTHFPQHPLLRTLMAHGYSGIVEQALAERRRAAQPPFACWAVIRAEAIEQQVPNRFLEQIALAAAGSAGIEVLGPVPAPIERRAGRFRSQLLLCAKTHRALHATLNHIEERIDGIDARRSVRWSLDVDPQDLY